MKIIFIIFKDNKYYIEYNAFDIELFFSSPNNDFANDILIS